MHTIKSRARHTAWKAKKGSTQWNPWARKIAHSGASLYDQESLHELKHTPHSGAHSETCIAGEVELNRMPDGYNGPVYAASMPPLSRGSIEPFGITGNGAGEISDRPSRRKKNKTDSERPMVLDFLPMLTKVQPRITPWTQFKHVMFGSWFNVLFLSVPAGFAVYYTEASPIAVFCVNFIALIPSIMTLDFALEEVGLHVGGSIQALLSITFGNAVQLISSIMLLKSRQIIVLQASLLGNILSNLLFMTGISFLCGGIKHQEQEFNGAVAHTISTFLLLASLSVVVPTVSHSLTEVRPGGIIAQSRGSSIIILISYGLWLLFQNKTHKDIFNTTPKQAKEWPGKVEIKPGALTMGFAGVGAAAAGAVGGKIHEDKLLNKQDDDDDDYDEEKIAVLTIIGGILATVFSTVLIGFHSEFATNSIQGLCQQAHLSQKFVGLVILPFLSFDHSAAVVATRNKMDMSISLTLERCMQTSLLVVPLVVLLAWCMGINDMTLEFDGFSTASLFASNIIVSYVVQQGKASWLTGALLIKIYLIIAIAAFFIT